MKLISRIAILIMWNVFRRRARVSLFAPTCESELIFPKIEITINELTIVVHIYLSVREYTIFIRGNFIIGFRESGSKQNQSRKTRPDYTLLLVKYAKITRLRNNFPIIRNTLFRR